jgi:hypothetical protein
VTLRRQPTPEDCINIGGFFDRDIDRMLGLDGVCHSTIYLVGIGRGGA